MYLQNLQFSNLTKCHRDRTPNAVLTQISILRKKKTKVKKLNKLIFVIS